jgi:hypothetical protein
LLLETNKLRVISVALGLAQKNPLRQKSLSPQSDQTLPVEVLRMNCPDAHCLAILCWRQNNIFQ